MGEDWPEWMVERYGDPSEWRERRIVIDSGEGEKHVRVSDAERHRRDWERYVGALRNKLESQLTEEEADLLRRVDAGETVLQESVSGEPGPEDRQVADDASDFTRTRIPHHFDFGQSEEEKQIIEKRLDEIEDEHWRRVQEWRDAGHLTAADHLERFLNGEGGIKTITREEAWRFPFAREAEAEARKRFENRSFVAKSGKSGFNDALKGLKEGDEPVEINDYWERVLGPGGFLKEWYAGDKDLARAFGKTNIKSNYEGRAERQGDTIYIAGEVTHSWNDPYDFDRFQPGSSGPLLLEKYGRAKKFKMKGSWVESVKGTVEVRDGKLVNPRFEWKDIDRK